MMLHRHFERKKAEEAPVEPKENRAEKPAEKPEEKPRRRRRKE